MKTTMLLSILSMARLAMFLGSAILVSLSFSGCEFYGHGDLDDIEIDIDDDHDHDHDHHHRHRRW